MLIADDHPLIIAGIRRSIEHCDDIEVVGEAHSGPELISMVDRRSPGIVLMDLRMPGITGVECIEYLRETRPELKIVVLSACDERPVIDAALCAGAVAYVLKSAHTVDIASVLRQAATAACSTRPRVCPAASTPQRRP